MINSVPKPKRIRDAKYLDWIRAQPCSVHVKDSAVCLGGIEAHHVRLEGHGGVGTKPDDLRTVPLCEVAHRFYHTYGKPKFEVYYRIELETQIKYLNALYRKEHPLQRGPRSEQKIKTYKKRLVHRGWGLIVNGSLAFPIVSSLLEAKQLRDSPLERVVRVQIRVEGTK